MARAGRWYADAYDALAQVYGAHDVADLLDTLLHVFSCGLARDAFEVFVVDNASTDGTAKAVAQRFPAVRLVRLKRNRGAGAKNVALREAAVRRGLHVSEYGILDDESGETLRCATEEAVYERLGLAWIPPELREGRGELEAAREDALPALITLEDLKGDLHMHTTSSDGLQTAEVMAEIGSP